MGLQVWPPSKPPPPSPMACLDVESPTVCRGKYKSVLQLCLQQRRSREQLVEQGIMPPLKMPAAFHEQIRHLERARTGNFLKHKICNRPERSELVRMHILQETQAEPSLQATQMRLKRARLADDLNEKLAQRPGAMELVVKNILPVADPAPSKDPPIAEQGNDPRTQDVYNFDENSTDSHPAAESAERTPEQTPQQATSASPREAGSPPSGPDHTLLPSSDSPGLGCSASTERPGGKHLVVLQPLTAHAPTTTATAPPVRGPILVKQSQPRSVGSEKNRAKKANKDPKPRVKKLKYHQYVPPDQKQDAGHEAPLDSAYVRLLQQQQQFLQLQILRQQQQHFVCQAVQQPATLSDGPAHSTRTPPPSMSDHLPSNLDEMKVAELKAELKLRGLLVSGTKNDLIERLRSHRDRSKGGPGAPVAPETVSPPGALVARVQRCESTPRSGSPVSPVAFKVSKMGLDERVVADAETRSPARPCGSPRRPCAQEEEDGGRRGSEKDQRLHEKERQIEELMRRLEREQKLVEELKMQLEVEKRGHHHHHHRHEESGAHSPSPPVRVKEECCASPAGLEQDRPGQSPSQQQQFFVTHQRLPTLAQTLQPGTRLHQPAAAVAVNLPDNRRHAAAPGGAAPDNNQTHGLMPQKQEAAGSSQQQRQSPGPTTQPGPPSSSPGLTSQVRTTQAQEDAAQHLLSTAPPMMPMMSKSKDPPRYEDAVKQTRCMQTAMQVPNTLSQHMDDLFDVLIESGEIMPFIGQDSSCPDKHIPVTASVTTLPVNTVLSRPPAQIQVAQPPDAPLNPASGLMGLVTMETLIEGTLRKQLLDHPLVGNMELDFGDSPALPSAGHLQNAHLETMDWLDLTTLPSHSQGEADAHLDMSPEAGVFSPDFLESPEFQLNWE